MGNATLRESWPLPGNGDLRRAFVVIGAGFLLASCAMAPPARRAPPIVRAEPGAVPERPPAPTPPSAILGAGLVSGKELSDFLVAANPEADGAFAAELAALYVEESAVEGVNHDVAFVQMCLETGFLRYGGLVTEDMNNFCGLGSLGPEAPGERFPTPRLGVRAHVQHLKGYATAAPLEGALIDPRYRWILKGSAPSLQDLAGRWASDPRYGDKLEALLLRLYDFAFPPF